MRTGWFWTAMAIGLCIGSGCRDEHPQGGSRQEGEAPHALRREGDGQPDIQLQALAWFGPGVSLPDAAGTSRSAGLYFTPAGQILPRRSLQPPYEGLQVALPQAPAVLEALVHLPEEVRIVTASLQPFDQDPPLSGQTDARIDRHGDGVCFIHFQLAELPETLPSSARLMLATCSATAGWADVGMPVPADNPEQLHEGLGTVLAVDGKRPRLEVQMPREAYARARWRAMAIYRDGHQAAVEAAPLYRSSSVRIVWQAEPADVPFDHWQVQALPLTEIGWQIDLSPVARSLDMAALLQRQSKGPLRQANEPDVRLFIRADQPGRAACIDLETAHVVTVPSERAEGEPAFRQLAFHGLDLLLQPAELYTLGTGGH